MDDTLTINELADRGRVTRRTVRFYVQRGLLSPPTGVGRGGHYTAIHLDELRRIGELQRAGHSLEEVGRLLRQPPTTRDLRRSSAGPPPNPPVPRPSSELWTRVQLAPGAELNLNATRWPADAAQLNRIRQAVRIILGLETDAPGSSPPPPPPTHQDTRKESR